MTILGHTSDSALEARHTRIHRRAIIQRLNEAVAELQQLEDDGPKGHQFISLDGIYCVRCALPEANWRHQ